VAKDRSPSKGGALSGDTIKIGSVWERREKQGDAFDRVVVRGRVFMGEHGEPDDFTVAPADEFGEVLQTSASGLLDYCECVEAGPQEGAAWEL
jgi:hypothetical protein